MFKRKWEINEHFFERPLTHEAAYLAGFIAADGAFYPKANKLFLNVARKDEDYLRQVSSLFTTQTPYRYIAKYNNGKISEASRLQITSKKILDDLAAIGIKGRKREREWPNIDENLLPAFISGYFDGDGYIRKDHLNISLACANKNFADGLARSLERLINVDCTVLYHSRAYYVDISGERAMKFIEMITDVPIEICLERKRRVIYYHLFSRWLKQSNADFLVLDEGWGKEPLFVIPGDKMLVLLEEAGYGKS